MPSENSIMINKIIKMNKLFNLCNSQLVFEVVDELHQES